MPNRKRDMDVETSTQIPGQLSFDMVEQSRPDPGRAQVGRFHKYGHDTEKIAASLVAPRSGTQRARVLELLQTAGDDGMTDYEMWVGGAGARPHVAGTRREELIADGWPIADSGRRRLTDTRSPAIVWVLNRRKS